MTALSTVEILCGAKTVLETNGWHQRAYVKRVRGKPESKCPVCSYGAIRLAANGDPHNPAGTYGAVRVLAQAVGTTAVMLDVWNDKAGRTLPEVLAAFDRAIEFAEAGDHHA